MRDSRNREGHLREEAHPSSSAAAGVRCWAARPAAAQAPAARGLDARPPAAAVGVRWVRPAAVQAAAAAHRLGARPRAPRPEAELQCRLDLCRTPGSCLSCSARRMRRRCAGWPAAVCCCRAQERLPAAGGPWVPAVAAAAAVAATPLHRWARALLVAARGAQVQATPVAVAAAGCHRVQAPLPAAQPPTGRGQLTLPPPAAVAAARLREAAALRWAAAGLPRRLPAALSWLHLACRPAAWRAQIAPPALVGWPPSAALPSCAEQPPHTPAGPARAPPAPPAAPAAAPAAPRVLSAHTPRTHQGQTGWYPRERRGSWCRQCPAGQEGDRILVAHWQRR